KGVPVDGVARNGIVQDAPVAALVTRSTTAMWTDGTTGILFTSAQVALAGTPADGERWTIRVGGTDYWYDVAGATTLASVAAGLAPRPAALTGPEPAARPTSRAAALRVSRAAAFTVRVTVSPAGSGQVDTSPAAATHVVDASTVFHSGDTLTVVLTEPGTSTL